MKLHRYSGHFGGCGGKENVRPDGAFAAERSANKWTDHSNIFDRNVPRARENALHALNELGGVKDGQLVGRFPSCDRAGHLDRLGRQIGIATDSRLQF